MPMPTHQNSGNGVESSSGSGSTSKVSVGSILCDNQIVTGDMLRGLLGNVGSTEGGASGKDHYHFVKYILRCHS